MNADVQISKQFEEYFGEDAILKLKNGDEIEGKLVTVDNFLNTVIDVNDELKVIKGGKVLFISIKQ